MRITIFIALPVNARHAGELSMSAVSQDQETPSGGRFSLTKRLPVAVPRMPDGARLAVMTRCRNEPAVCSTREHAHSEAQIDIRYCAGSYLLLKIGASANSRLYKPNVGATSALG